MGDVTGLFPVDSAGAREQEAAGAVASSGLKGALGAGEDGRQHVEGSVGGLSCAGIGRGMDDEAEVAFREGEVTDVSGEKRDSGISGEVGAFGGEAGWVAGEDGGVGVEVECAVDVYEALDEPAAEEASATGDEDALIAHAVP